MKETGGASARGGSHSFIVTRTGEQWPIVVAQVARVPARQ